MADNVARARGRARGRARASQPAGGAGGAGGAGPPRPGGQQGPPPASAGPGPGGVGRAPRGAQGGPGGLQQHQPQQQQAPPPPHHQQQQQQGGAPQGRPAPRGAAGAGAGGAGGGLDPSALASRLQNVSLGGQDPTGSVGRGTARGRRAVEVELVRTRPEHITSKKGVSGSRLIVSANYFKLETHTDWRLYQYRVDFDPETDHTAVKKGLLRVHRATLGGYIFDGSMMFTSQLLTQDPSRPIELFSKRADEVNIRITVKYVGDLAVGDHHYLQFFNILMRKCLYNLKLQLVGRNFFDPVAKVDVREHKLELWPGYLTSIRQHENAILMCAEITHKVMRKDTVLDLLQDLVRQGSRGDVRKMFQQTVIGAVVLTDYNNRTYRIDDVDFDVSPDSTFKLSSGQEISYRQYYRQKYQITIVQGDQPMLVSRTKPREQRAGMSSMVYLIPELCRMTGLTDTMRNNFHLMRALADHTRVGAQARIDKLIRFCQRLNSEPAIVQDFQEWKMRLGQRLVEFDARVLQNEAIIQAGNDKYGPSGLVDWTRDLRSRPMLLLPEFQSWVVVVPGQLKKDTMNFVSTLQKAAGGMRFRIPPPLYFDINDDRAGTYVEAIEKVINSKNPQLIMTVVPNNRADRYSSIKKKCCVDRAILNQVILGKNLASKGVMSIATKVAVQINSKIGGAPWTVELPLTNLMVVGFDVCHDTAAKGKSYGAMVASLDKSLSRYFSAVSAHTTGEELSNDLSLNLVRAVRKYQEYNNSLPTRIIIYRDGVGEGQISYVFQHEVNMIREQLGQAYASQNLSLKLAFIIVTKRINTRIFLKNDNPPPGTVVDDCITSPERYDFFLVSQTVRQGTVSPTYYNVISDNVGLDPDKMQRLTYKLTHLYFNWSGTVRVPAPCQYAHKLAYLVGQCLHRAPNSNLENYLYYL